MNDAFAFPDATAAKPLWLITLADLALLLVGFFVLVQATSLDRAALAKGLRAGPGRRRFSHPNGSMAPSSPKNWRHTMHTSFNATRAASHPPAAA